MPRIVHLGVGNFHRAHQAWYTAQAGGWDITGVVMTNARLKAEMAAHGNRYALGIWGPQGLRVEDIAIHDEVLLATEAAPDIIARIADPRTQIVTLTITETGYHLDPEGRLDLRADPIARDLARDRPQSALGLLAAGLAQRVGAAPLTVISCDNLSQNGDKLRQAIKDYLSVAAPDALPWLATHVAFPNCMVDRITPRLSDAAQADIQAASRSASGPCVGTEAFSEWIIEDDFRGDRPDWAKAGAVFAPDISSFEHRKLRCLNAAHSYLAYAGQAAGHRYVHEAIADPGLRSGVEQLWDEAEITISAPAAETLGAYRAALIERFSVAAMRHALAQIAMDGSVKLRERIVPTLTLRAAQGLASPACETAIAAWLTHLDARLASGDPLDDPTVERLRPERTETPTQRARLRALIGL